MTTNTISIKQIADNLRSHPLMNDLSLENIIRYTVDFIRILGIPDTFSEKTVILSVENYMSTLPEDFMEIIQVRTAEENPVYFRYSTDNFHGSDNKIHASPFTYKIQGTVIVTSTKSGDIEIAYRGIEVDTCGLPLIPDNSKFIRALESYIKMQYFTILFDLGKINGNSFQNAQQEYCWAVGACETEYHMPTLDKMESIGNMANTLLPRTRSHQYGYANTGDKEILRRH